ncbi:MAG: hypothetical protein IT380_16280 [Myxococcales bacterium]|nr:hypothetical protein [Myxococcales bacterium]
MSVRYTVCIAFREPTYEAVTYPRTEPFTWTMKDVKAKDEDEARKVAVGRFRELASLSSVGWIREIESVRVILH